MAKPNGRGGWDLTDDDVAEIRAASFGEDKSDEDIITQTASTLSRRWLEHAHRGTKASPAEFCREYAELLASENLLREPKSDNLHKIAEFLKREGGVLQLSYYGSDKEYIASCMFGKEAPDSDMYAGHSIQFGETVSEAVNKVAQELNL